MFCQFSVKNYRSIRDEMTFDMQAATLSEHVDTLITGSDGEQFLPVAVLYGPNGGGKTNVLSAMNAMIGKVLRPLLAAAADMSVLSPSNTAIVPYAFGDARRKPTEFELYFRTGNAEYRYILHIQDDRVVYESMDRIKLTTARKRISGLFERESGKVLLKGDFRSLKVNSDISDTLPVLSYLGISYAQNPLVMDILDWFRYSICFLNYGDPRQELRMALTMNSRAKALFLSMIQEMDLDIEDYRIQEYDDGHIDIFTRHVVDGEPCELNLLEESSGTRKLFGVLPFVARSLLEGSVMVIDELDAKLHPVLLRYIISLFTDPMKNSGGAQLVFTSHDLSTMNSEVFRRDEIWFVAKGNEQNSELYSLVEFKTNGALERKDTRYDKRYLEGRYGADPYLQKIINWENLHA